MLNTNITPTVNGVFSVKPTETQLMAANANGDLKKVFDLGMDLYNWNQDLKSAKMLEEDARNAQADAEAEASQKSEIEKLLAELSELQAQKAAIEEEDARNAQAEAELEAMMMQQFKPLFNLNWRE